jgi:hypothetical protein
MALEPDADPLAFRCAGGHSLTLDALLHDALLRGDQSPASAFELWPQKVILLQRLARQALALGKTLVAAELQDSANRIDQWVSNLRVLLSKESVVISAEISGKGATKQAPEEVAGKRR